MDLFEVFFKELLGEYLASFPARNDEANEETLNSNGYSCPDDVVVGLR